jgi:predicted nuclease of predicted toxin-antitoxin system
VRLLVDEMYSERVAELLRERGHDAVHVREIGLGGAPDADVLSRAAEDGRTLVTENAVDFLPLLDRRQGAGLAMVPVLIALTSGRGVGGALHAQLATGIDRWARQTRDPYAHAHWLP